MKVFVYGTLMQGYSNHSLVRPYLTGIKAAKTQGLLYNLGSFPGMKRGNGQVIGELIIIGQDYQQEVLERLDILEGHPDFYRREKVEVEELETGQKHMAWTYIYNSDTLDKSRLINSGDWKEVN
ncbi:MAG: gamma-glutamylcyclotransferase [Halarsenatibacteraceae bacterium]